MIRFKHGNGERLTKDQLDKLITKLLAEAGHDVEITHVHEKKRQPRVTLGRVTAWESVAKCPIPDGLTFETKNPSKIAALRKPLPRK